MRNLVVSKGNAARCIDQKGTYRVAESTTHTPDVAALRLRMTGLASAVEIILVAAPAVIAELGFRACDQGVELIVGAGEAARGKARGGKADIGRIVEVLQLVGAEGGTRVGANIKASPIEDERSGRSRFDRLGARSAAEAAVEVASRPARTQTAYFMVNFLDGWKKCGNVQHLDRRISPPCHLPNGVERRRCRCFTAVVAKGSLL